MPRSEMHFPRSPFLLQWFLWATLHKPSMHIASKTCPSLFHSGLHSRCRPKMCCWFLPCTLYSHSIWASWRRSTVDTSSVPNPILFREGSPWVQHSMLHPSLLQFPLSLSRVPKRCGGGNPGSIHHPTRDPIACSSRGNFQRTATLDPRWVCSQRFFQCTFAFSFWERWCLLHSGDQHRCFLFASNWFNLTRTTDLLGLEDGKPHFWSVKVFPHQTIPRIHDSVWMRWRKFGSSVRLLILRPSSWY